MIDSRSEINAIYLSFVKQLGLLIGPTDVEVQKIEGTTLDTHGMVVAACSMVDKANQEKFFEKTFLMANISPEIVFGILFFIFSDADIDFLGQKL